VSGGRLTIECGFDAATTAPDDMARLMSCIEHALATLIRHCSSDEAGGLTPSDVPGLDIDQDDLDALLEEVAALAP
jgi:non-ribosomal peptide synthase protein (TIGR01720 family)